MADEEVKMIKLVSSDGHEFLVDKKAALVSGTIKSMLEGSFMEGEQGRVEFREISTPILEKVIQYFYYKLRFTNSTSSIPEFPIEPEIGPWPLTFPRQPHSFVGRFS